MGQMPKNRSWPESMKGWGPESYQESWRTDYPQYDLNKNETQNKQTFPQLIEELAHMPEAGDHYIGTEILLPRGDNMARSHAVAQSHNSNRNAMARLIQI